jgi:8-oxo-dGTP diphosphatase
MTKYIFGAFRNDRVIQYAYIFFFRMARLWWWLRRPQHQGALVALWVKDRLLLVQQSYREGLTLPGGGVRKGELPRTAAQRELCEELGLEINASDLTPVCIIGGEWDYRHEQVYVFALHLDQEPTLYPDQREITSARFLAVETLTTIAITPALRAYLQRSARSKPPLKHAPCLAPHPGQPDIAR